VEPVSTILQDEDTDALSVQTEQRILSGPGRGGAPTEEAGLSLVERAERIFRHGQAAEAVDTPMETCAYSDGYVRRSPPQRYRVPEGYYRRLIWKAALYAAAVVLLALLLVALMKRRLLRF
jgi:hypothetical protein